MATGSQGSSAPVAPQTYDKPFGFAPPADKLLLPGGKARKQLVLTVRQIRSLLAFSGLPAKPAIPERRISHGS
jgi:hypothetical protein